MTVHCIKEGWFDTNIYLVTGQRPFLVDTGTGKGYRDVISQIRELVPIEDIERIVLTHRHYDHVGGAKSLSEVLDAEVFIHPDDAEPVREGDDRGTLAREFLDTVEPLSVTEIREGEVISSGEHEFQVLHTPGHTIGSICLLDKVGGMLISGDTVFAGNVGRWDLPTGDLRLLRESVRRLVDLSPSDLFPGHGAIALGDAESQLKIAMRYLGV